MPSQNQIHFQTFREAEGEQRILKCQTLWLNSVKVLRMPVEILRNYKTLNTPLTENLSSNTESAYESHIVKLLQDRLLF